MRAKFRRPAGPRESPRRCWSWSGEDRPVVGCGANDDTKAVAADPEDAAYWLRNREGWFWYRDPPAAARRPSLAGTKATARAGRVRGDAEAPGRPEARAVAMNPTDANLTAYMRYQRMVMNKSEHSPSAGSAWCGPYRSRLRPERTAHQRDGDQRLRRTAARAAGADHQEPGRHPRAHLRVPRRLPALPPLRADPQALRGGVRVLAISMTAAPSPSTRTPGPTTAWPRA